MHPESLLKLGERRCHDAAFCIPLTGVRQSALDEATSHGCMASDPSQPAAAVAGQPPASSAAPDQAIFVLSRPLKDTLDGAEIDLHGIGMRALDTPDLPLLDQFRGRPIALAQNVIAALCDITVEQVRQLALEDFTMLASDALFQVEQLSAAIGLPDHHFIDPRGEGEQA